MSVEDHGHIIRGQAPVSGVSVPGALAAGSDLVHSLDYVVMLQLLCNLAAGMTSTPLSVWKQLQERGIRSSKNANELVGKNAVYESFTRLICAGYLRRCELPNEKHPGRKGPIQYEVFDNPSWNPDWQATQVGTSPLRAADSHDLPQTKAQVGTLPGTPEPSSGEVDKSAGQNASRNAGTVVQGSGVPGSGMRHIPAGQNASRVPGRIEPSPPHPPEEVTTSSPNPLTTAHPSQTEGGEGMSFGPEDLLAAARFLQRLPAPWTQGRPNAKTLAPQLLTVMSEQGWPTIADVDPKLLEAAVATRPEGVKNPYRILEKDRIPNLPLYEVVAPAQTMPQLARRRFVGSGL